VSHIIWAAHLLQVLQEEKRVKHLKEGLGVIELSGPEVNSFNELVV